MALPRYQFTVQDDQGNVLSGVACKVTLELDGSVPVLYSDPAGLTPVGNPVYGDNEGFVYFHVAIGVYKIVFTYGSFQRVYRYVGIGTDGGIVGPESSTTNAIVLYSDTTGKNIKDSAVTIDTATNLGAGAASNLKVATQLAVKTYIDALAEAINAVQYKGVIDCSSNPNYPAASAGHLYIVSVAGKIGGGSGQTVEAGDLILCKTDSTSSGDHATVGAQWDIVQYNVDGALTSKITANIIIGYTFTPYSIGTVSTGTTTPNAANGNYQYMTNNGASTLAAPSSDCAIDILITNGASAGSLSFSGFTVSSLVGDSLTTTNTNKFLISIRRINSVATYIIKALQ